MDNLGKYVLAINENRNMTKAAKELGISQPALSSSLNSIEKKLGYQIFDRKKSPLEPTGEGKVYIDYLKKILVLEADLDKKIGDIQAGLGRNLTIGAPATYVESILLDAVARFNTLDADCRVKVVESTVPELIKKSRDNQVDLFISTSNSLPDNFTLEHVVQEKIYLCIPKNWEINTELTEYVVDYKKNKIDSKEPNLKTKPIPISLLKDQQFIFLEEEQPLQVGINNFFEKNMISPKSCMEVDQVKTALRLAIAGCGICFASSSVLNNCQELDKLCVYSLDDQAFVREVYVAYSENNYLSESAKQFMEVLKEMNRSV